MAHQKTRTTLSIILASCKADRIEAGVRRDGTGVARITPVLNILDALAENCRDLSSRHYLRIEEERHKARMTRLFCEIHDRAARGEITEEEYVSVLASARDRHGEIASHRSL